MTKSELKDLDVELDEDLDGQDDDCLDEGDFCFVIGAEGELKEVLIPAGNNGIVPEKVMQLFKLYGIRDVDDLPGNATIH